MLTQGITIEITEKDHEYAELITQKLKEELQGKGLTSRFNTNWDENVYLGNLGEILISRWLKKHGISFEWQNDRLGEPDDTDFIINNQKWDVKTALRRLPIEDIDPDNFKLFVNARQLLEHPSDYYLWILVQGPNLKHSCKAVIIGYLALGNITSFENKNPLNQSSAIAKWIPISESLPPNIALITMGGTQ